MRPDTNSIQTIVKTWLMILDHPLNYNTAFKPGLNEECHETKAVHPIVGQVVMDNEEKRKVSDKLGH